MENNLAKKIFDSQNLLSREEFNVALSGDLATKHKVAESVMQSDFESDAFDGFHENNYSTQVLESLDEKMQQHLMTYKKPGSNSTYIIGVWFLLFFGIVVLTFVLNVDKSDRGLYSLSSEIPQQKKNVMQATENIEEIQEIKLSNERFIVTESKTTSSSKNKAGNFSEDKPPSPREEVPKKMEPLGAIQLNQRNKNLTIKKSMVKEVMLSDFIFVDYRGLRSEQDFREFELSGLRANLRSNDSKDPFTESENQSAQVSYHQFLSETAAAMKAKNWAHAAERFELILNKYPDDLNALFYLAFIKFNQTAFEESLRYLNLSEKSVYGNFDQETAWYQLKNYLELSNFDLARKQAQKIIEEDGFYKGQAEELLRGMRR